MMAQVQVFPIFHVLEESNLSPGATPPFSLPSSFGTSVQGFLLCSLLAAFLLLFDSIGVWCFPYKFNFHKQLEMIYSHINQIDVFFWK